MDKKQLRLHVSEGDLHSFLITRDCRDRDRMVVGFTTTCAISAYQHQSCEFECRSWHPWWSEVVVVVIVW